MREWRSLDEIVAAFELPEECSRSSAAVRVQLRKRLQNLHPDSNSGTFATAGDEEAYHDTMSAIDYIDRSHGVEATKLPSTNLRPPGLPLVSVSREPTQIGQSRIVENIDRKVKSKYWGIRLRSGVIAGGIVTILGLSEKIAALPLLGDLLSSISQTFPLAGHMLAGVLLIGLAAAVVVFFRAWKSEAKAKALAESLTTDGGISELFSSYPLQQEVEKTGLFTSINLIAAIESSGGFYEQPIWRLLPHFLHRKLPFNWTHVRPGIFKDDPALSQQVADFIISKLEERGAISKIENGALVPQYRVNNPTRK